MRNEHAIVYKERLTAENLDYVCRKANKLGRRGHHLTRVYMQEDAEGTHIYFEVDYATKEGQEPEDH